MAEQAETASAIERVRPWKRKLQPCKLAPHVIVPQWVRMERVETPVHMAEDVVAALISSVLDEACKSAKHVPVVPHRGVVTRQRQSERVADAV